MPLLSQLPVGFDDFLLIRIPREMQTDLVPAGVLFSAKNNNNKKDVGSFNYFGREHYLGGRQSRLASEDYTPMPV